MRKISFHQYEEGIADLLVFFDMLENALYRTLPGVKLIKSSAYGWKGFEIVEYPGLKERHYFCEIYLNTPHVQ